MGYTEVRTRAAEVATTGRKPQRCSFNPFKRSNIFILNDAETLVGVVSIEAVEDDEVLDVTEETENTEVEAVTSEDVCSRTKKMIRQKRKYLIHKKEANLGFYGLWISSSLTDNKKVPVKLQLPS